SAVFVQRRQHLPRLPATKRAAGPVGGGRHAGESRSYGDPMSDMLNALIAAGALPQTSYGTSSRYYGLPVVELKMPDGSVIRYVRRRFIPQLANFPTLAVHQVQQGDRIDLVSARYLGDP